MICAWWCCPGVHWCLGPHWAEVLAWVGPHPLMNRSWQPRGHFNIKTVFPGIGIPIIKIRRSWDRLIFIMRIPILVTWHFCTATAPRHSWLPVNSRYVGAVVRDARPVVASWRMSIMQLTPQIKIDGPQCYYHLPTRQSESLFKYFGHMLGIPVVS